MFIANKNFSISRNDFSSFMKNMGFNEVVLSNSSEYTYERTVTDDIHPSTRFSVRIFSNIDKRSGLSRGYRVDNYRIIIFDNKLQRGVMDMDSVRCTENSIPIIKEQVRKAWNYTLSKRNHCPKCGALLLEKKGKKGAFIGCSNYPKCTYSKSLVHEIA